MDFVLQIWSTVVSVFCESHPNLSAPPIFFPTSGVLPQFEKSSDATALVASNSRLSYVNL